MGLLPGMRHISVVPLRAGRHNLQEDHPDAIGRTVAGWIAGIEAVTSRTFGFRRMTTAMAIFEDPAKAQQNGYLERA